MYVIQCKLELKNSTLKKSFCLNNAFFLDESLCGF